MQAAHASHEAGIYLAKPANSPSSAVLLAVKNEIELLAAKTRATSKNIQSVVFREPDINNQATAMCTEPLPRHVGKVFSNYKLWSARQDE